MATINLYNIYQNKLRKFNFNESARFSSSFVEAVNNVFSELNDQVFQAQTLDLIGSFDDVIDNRLASFTDMTFDSVSDTAISGREYWSIEYDFERTNTANTFIDTIDDDASDVVVSITNDVLTLTGGAVTGKLTLPSGVDVFTVWIESYADGNRVLINGDEYVLEYTLGDSDTTQPIGAVASHITSAVTGLELTQTRFLSAGTMIYKFLINEGTGTTVADEVAAYSNTLTDPVWEIRYIEPSNSLSTRYFAPFNMGIEYHLQEGGEWALEPIADRERKWYGRGIQQARNIFQQTTEYINPLQI